MEREKKNGDKEVLARKNIYNEIKIKGIERVEIMKESPKSKGTPVPSLGRGGRWGAAQRYIYGP